MKRSNFNCITPQPLYSGKRAWDFLHKSYPPCIESIFRAIAEELRSVLPGCGLSVLGSFSTATARWLMRGGKVMFISDIDLMATTQEDKLEDVLLKRDIVTSRLAEIAKSVKKFDQGFHIGIRYRSYNELNAFIQKTASVGYPFWHNTLWILEGSWRTPLIPRNDFSPGHCAENICNMLWVVLRYSRPPLWRSATRAIECMQTSVNYLSNRIGTTSAPPAQPSERHNLESLKANLLRYGQMALDMAQEYPGSCRTASRDEEFDFFRVAPNEPTLLPKFLMALLNLAWDLDKKSRGSIYLRKVISLAPKLGLCVETSSNEGMAFENLRYYMAVKRMGTSPLFNRDRGTCYLALFRKTTKHGQYYEKQR